MGGLSQKYLDLIKNSEVKVNKIRGKWSEYDFTYEFETYSMEYSFWNYEFTTEVIIGGQEIEIGVFRVERIGGQLIRDTAIINAVWAFTTPWGSDWEEMWKDLPQVLSIPELPPSFFYYATMDIAKQLNLYGPDELIEFNMSFEYVRRRRNFYLKDVEVYKVGFYEKFEFNDLGEIDFGRLALRLSRRFNYQLGVDTVVEIVKWWFGVLKTALVEFYNDLLKTGDIKVLKKKRLENE